MKRFLPLVALVLAACQSAPLPPTPTATPAPLAAASLPGVSADRRTYTSTIREGLTYFDDLALYHDAQRLLTFEAPVAFLYWSQQASLVSPRVHAWTLAPWDPGFPISRLTDLAVDPR